MRNSHCYLDFGEKTEKCGKWDTNTVRPGILQETLKNMENGKCTMWNLQYGEETENHAKWEMHSVGCKICRETLKNVKNENAHCKTSKMAIKL